jgi:hypothetical protein
VAGAGRSLRPAKRGETEFGVNKTKKRERATTLAKEKNIRINHFPFPL